ncbi:uncharacterized protein V1518DRAFT_411509 [Limtongia smithiae]|uniref:uncharacterized protein n=1 Tax=Limtongia smithiae TaxID=1125753 RepID=UPI0034CD6F5A
MAAVQVVPARALLCARTATASRRVTASSTRCSGTTITVRGYRASPRAEDYMDFVRRIPLLNRAIKKPEESGGARKKVTDLDEVEQEEMSLATPSDAETAHAVPPVTAVSSSPSEYDAVKLSELYHRVSRVRPLVTGQVPGVTEKDFPEGTIIEIGLRQPVEREEITPEEILKVTPWKRRTEVHDAAVVSRIMQIVLADHRGKIAITWPSAQEVATADPYEAIVKSFSTSAAVSSITDIDTFALNDIAMRFAILKRISQLTGRRIPDYVLNMARTLREVRAYYAHDTHTHHEFGLRQEDPYNKYTTKLFIDPKPFVGTNVKISA